MEIRSKRAPMILAGLLLVAAAVFAAIHFKRPAPLPAFESLRPVGTADDIVALKDRDDVNVLFVLVDTMRSHRMSAYGYERDTTPFMSTLARSGIRFGRNISQSSWTKSSMASLWTGLNPLHVGITKFDHTLSKDLVLPAEIMKDAGFFNVALYRNGWLHGYFGFDQGFDKYFRPVGSRADREAGGADPNVLSIGTDESLAREAEEFLRMHGRSSRWFLYLHLMDLHEYVYDKESALFGTTASDIYDNSIRRIDWIVSLLFSSLNRFGLLDKTIVVIAADHGEAFGERGFEGHAREVLPETTETPLLISLPFALSEGVVLKTPTSNMDLWPTVLDLLGLPGMGPDIDGRSRLPEILAAARSGGPGAPAAPESDEPQAAPIIAYLDQNWGQNIASVEPNISVVQGDYRYVAGNNSNGAPFEALFSIADSEHADRTKEKPEIAAELRTIAQAQLEAKPVHGPGNVKMDQMQLDQLRALGYEIH